MIMKKDAAEKVVSSAINIGVDAAWRCIGVIKELGE